MVNAKPSAMPPGTVTDTASKVVLILASAYFRLIRLPPLLYLSLKGIYLSSQGIGRFHGKTRQRPRLHEWSAGASRPAASRGYGDVRLRTCSGDPLAECGDIHVRRGSHLSRAPRT